MALSPIINVMLRAAEKAGRALVRDFGEVEQLQVSQKGPGDFVTAADRRSEEILHSELSKARPEFGFLMEEGGEIKGAAPARWIIDPLDGTHNFLHGIPHWCLTIALEENGEITAGVTYDPIRDEMFRVEKGGPAFLRNKRLQVSGRRNLKDAMIAGSLPNLHQVKSDPLKQALYPLLEATHCFRSSGSAALDLAYVAAGRYDGYFEVMLKPWDLATGLLLVREAGGMCASLLSSNSPLQSGTVLAANGHIYHDLKKILNGNKGHEAA